MLLTACVLTLLSACHSRTGMIQLIYKDAWKSNNMSKIEATAEIAMKKKRLLQAHLSIMHGSGVVVAARPANRRARYMMMCSEKSLSPFYRLAEAILGKNSNPRISCTLNGVRAFKNFS